MNSGSFRAFDRRPLEPAARDKQPPGDGASTSSPNNIMVHSDEFKTSLQDTTMLHGDVATVSPQDNIKVARTSSTETSYSGEDHADLPEIVVDRDWSGVDDLGLPLWDWEQLHWP